MLNAVNLQLQNDTCIMPNRITTVEECDATDDASSNAADNKKRTNDSVV